jgi:voltage-gated potassium channel
MIINKNAIRKIIIESDTRAGKIFDIILIFLILLSVLTVILESVHPIYIKNQNKFELLEIFFTTIFTIELGFRLYVVPNKLRYVFSFFGIVDILSILPLYFHLILPGIISLGVIRIFRFIRIFRILKLERYLIASMSLSEVVRSSLPRVIVFLFIISMVVTVMGSIVFVIEGPENGFTSIPVSIYWAILNLTSVGTSEILPKTILGKIFSSILMIIGYGIIAVPTGLISAEFVHKKITSNGIRCSYCGSFIQGQNISFCSSCGKKIN